MRRLICVPGIYTTHREAEAWAESLGTHVMTTCPDVEGYHVYSTGWVGASTIGFPGLGHVYRRRAVGRYQAWVSDLVQAVYAEDRRLDRPKTEIDVFGYSWGTYLVGHSMSDRPGPGAIYDRVVLMGSILSSRDDWRDKAGHYGRALNLYSREDQVVRFARLGPFGQSGAIGFTLAPENVRQQEFPKYEHGDYQKDGPAWDRAAEFLATS